ncbi:MAG: TIR domain-containing protein [Rhodocyclaceae bacterium]|nr:TIR domain-containing protein [Rhodocyclaceae bacterium]
MGTKRKQQHDEAPPPAPTAPRRLAVLIGNGRVDGPEGGLCLDIEGIDRDLEAMAAVLGDAESAGFEVISLFEPRLIDARREIARIARSAGPEDTLLIYYSGCSLKVGGQLYLPMRDADASFIEATCLDADFLLQELRHSLSEQIVILLDGCHSGAFFAYNRGVPNGFFALSSCSADEISYGDAAGGAFSRLLVEGLAGARADADGDGVVTTDELFRYVLPRARAGGAFPPTTPQMWSWNLPQPIALTHVRRRIFLSYRRADSAVADSVVEALEQQGFGVWVDREDIGGGSRWRDAIAQAIQDCDALVFLMSASALESDEVYKELAMASQLGRPIIPLQLGEVHLIGWHKAELGQLQIVFHDAADEARQWLGDLIAGVRKACAGRAATPAR